MSVLPQFFLKTKLLPPRLGRQVIARPRLIERMRGMVDLPATIVTANAGCGKTTLVTGFVHACGLPCIWYQIDRADIDLAVFFGYLVHGMRKINSEFGEVVLGYIRESEEIGSRAEQLADVFVNEVSDKIEEKTVIVLDDYHLVDGSEPIALAVDRMLQYLPDVLHIIINSRSMPNLSITRLSSKGLVGIIDRQDLLFTRPEVEQLFKETFERPLRADLIGQFHAKTEGWITALQLVRQALDRAVDRSSQQGREPAEQELIAALQQSEVNIFDYFAEEVLEAELPATRLMLGRLSLLERIGSKLVTGVFPGSDYLEQLRTMSRRNVFVTQTYVGTHDEEYRIHPLFHSFLRRWLEAKAGPAEVNEMHQKIAAYFIETGQWDQAIHHLTEASAIDDVAILLSDHGAELSDLGRFEVVKRAFDQISPGSLTGHPRALIARADIALMEGDDSRARSLYADAAGQARQLREPEIEAEAIRGLAYVARHSGDPKLSIELAQEALDLAPDRYAFRARCHNIIGLCRFFSLGDSEGAIASWRAALEEARRGSDARFARIVLHNLGLPYSMEGDFNEALRWLSQITVTPASNDGNGVASPAISDAVDDVLDHPAASEQGMDSLPFPQEAIGHLNVGRLKIVQGKLDEAESHLRLALDRCRMFNLTSSTGETLEAFGNLYRERGDYGRALAFYDEAARSYRDAGLAPAERELPDERASLFLDMGEVTRAESEADEYYRARIEGSPGEQSTALITRGRIHMAAHRFAEAESSLAAAAGISADARLRYNEARASTSLARLLWDAGREREAVKALGRAAELSQRYDYSYWLAAEASRSPDLFRAATEADISPAYLASLIPAKAVDASSGAEISQLPEEERLTQMSAVDFIEGPKCDLAINMLGPVSVDRGPAEPMPDDAWRLSKSLHILCYIASRRNRRAPKDSIVETFWAEAEPETIAKNFHPTISHLRRALNGGQMIKKDFILYREGAYILDPQYHYSIDTEEFESRLSMARDAERSGDLERAARITTDSLALYRGDFLEELYYDWVHELQSYYTDLYIEALKKLVTFHSGKLEYELAIRYGQMILQRDPYREDAHCQVMEAFVRIGNRAAAIEQFDDLRKMLRKELGVDPLPATVAKYESLIR